jgi:hypothetical protein
VQSLGLAWDSRSREEGGQRWFHLYPEEDAMDHRHPLHWTRRDQTWNYQCAECHSTNLQKNYDVTTDSYRTAFEEIDVACEACNGAGSSHVLWAEAAARNPGRRDDADKGLAVDLGDRFDYVSTISDSWKSQLLLNIVKLRYADAPAFLDVGSVISQYEFAAELNVPEPGEEREVSASLVARFTSVRRMTPSGARSAGGRDPAVRRSGKGRGGGFNAFLCTLAGSAPVQPSSVVVDLLVMATRTISLQHPRNLESGGDWRFSLCTGPFQ